MAIIFRRLINLMKRFLTLLTCQLLLTGLCIGQNNWQWLNPRPTGYSCLNVVFTDHQRGYILNSNGDLISTSDQGNSWKITGHFPGAVSMAIQDSTGVIATYGGGLYATFDNGNSWGAINVDTTDQFAFVNVVSRDSFFVSTTAGRIYATGD